MLVPKIMHRLISPPANATRLAFLAFLQQQRIGGLKQSLRLFTFVAALVLLINLSWFIWAKYQYGITTGTGTVQQGDCSEAKRLNTWLHLLINILSTVLLMGSNAFMQTISGPTRQEVDRAHRQHRWLRIGTLSFRNLHSIAKRKGLLCGLLALSSVPFHLLYNSLIFASVSANNYHIAVVTEEFTTGAPWNLTEAPRSWTSRWTIDGPSQAEEDRIQDYQQIQQSLGSYDRLDQSQCIREYSNGFISSRRHVVAISSDKNKSNSVLVVGNVHFRRRDSSQRADTWLCPETNPGTLEPCDANQVLANAENWQAFGHPIEYCLSENVDSVCAVQFSFDIMIVLLIFNSLKLLIMCYILFRLDVETILTCVGDSVQSFLTDQDENTLGMPLADNRNIDNLWPLQDHSQPPNQSPKAWAYAVSRKRWALFFLMMCAVFVLIIPLLAWGLALLKKQGLDISLPSLWRLGFGIVTPKTVILIEDVANVALVAMLANAPQVPLTIIFLTYNGLVTTMFTAQDWDRFGLQAQGLMVSSPQGCQRGTWLLGAPLGAGLALLTLHTLLHWLVSQSLFAIQITAFQFNGDSLPVYRVSNCGFSAIAIVATLITVAIMSLAVTGLGYRRFDPGGPPIVSTCSAAISAACHPGRRGEGMVFERLRWVASGSDGTADGSRVSSGFVSGEDSLRFREGRKTLKQCPSTERGD